MSGETAIDRLAHAAFLRDPGARAVLDALDAARPGATRFVGGCVRDALMRRSTGDVDLATALQPEETMAALKAAGLKAVPTGIAHGTITAVAQGRGIEVTTLRRDVETDGRRAVVAFTDDWAEDAMRRDFRLNALYADREGRVFDPTGHGVADAKAGRVVFVGDAATRIAEDGLRILRFFRFHATHGRGAPDASGLAACAAGLDALSAVSAERVWVEVRKLLGAPDPRTALAAMAESGASGRALPEAEAGADLSTLIDMETDLLIEPDALVRLMVLLPRELAVVDRLAARLRLSRAEAERLRRWAKDETRIVSWLSMREVRAAGYRLGTSLMTDRVTVAAARDDEPRRAPQWRALRALAMTFAPPTFPITGDQVVAAGARPGPAVGAILRELEDWWIATDFADDELGLIERLKSLVQALG